MKKRQSVFVSGMRWSLSFGKAKVGLLFGTRGGPDTATLQALRAVTNTLETATWWEGILHPEFNTGLLGLEACEFEGWSRSALHSQFFHWVAQMKRGKTPRSDEGGEGSTWEDDPRLFWRVLLRSCGLIPTSEDVDWILAHTAWEGPDPAKAQAEALAEAWKETEHTQGGLQELAEVWKRQGGEGGEEA